MYPNLPSQLRMYRFSRQAGLSLIELLIGITIGLLVMLAAIGTLNFTRVSALAVTDTVRMQQDALIAMEMIGRQLRQSRAVAVQENPDTAGTGVSIVNYRNFAGLAPATPGQVAIQGQADVGVTPDNLISSFGVSQIAGMSATCLGSATNLPDTVSSQFDVAGGSLRCRPSDAANAAQGVIDNVQDFQVWYGVRDDVLLNVSYRTAAQMALTPQDWRTVDSVMVCLRLQGTTTNVPQPVGFVQAGCQRNEVVAWNGRYQKVYRQVFTVRNPGFFG